MKTHLFRPGEKLTMCGITIKAFSTTDPSKVDCKRCSGMYAVNVDWYRDKLKVVENGKSSSGGKIEEW